MKYSSDVFLDKARRRMYRRRTQVVSWNSAQRIREDQFICH